VNFSLRDGRGNLAATAMLVSGHRARDTVGRPPTEVTAMRHTQNARPARSRVNMEAGKHSRTAPSSCCSALPGCFYNRPITDVVPVQAATVTSSAANARDSEVLGTRSDAALPSKVPMTAATVTGMITRQSKGSVVTRTLSEAAELITMTSSDVSIAVGIGQPRITTSVGTTRNSPPTPNRPVTRAVTAPEMTIVAGRVPRADRASGVNSLAGAALAASELRRNLDNVASKIKKCKGQQQHIRIEVTAEDGAPDGGEGLDRTETQAVGPTDLPCPGSGEQADHRADPHDDQDRRGRTMRAFAEEEDQRGHRQHRPAAAEPAQYQSHPETDRERNRGHGAVRSLTGTMVGQFDT
jgi:hypothetical protein